MSICVVKRVAYHTIKALEHPAATTELQDPWLTGAVQQRLANDAATNAVPRMQHRPATANGPLAELGITKGPHPTDNQGGL